MDIKKHQVLKDKDNKLWVIDNCDDLCNCSLLPVNFEGDWLVCLDKYCERNELDEFEFMN